MPPTTYKYLSQLDQILIRPGQHIGSASSIRKAVWLAPTIDTIVEKEIDYNVGLIHLFYEILANAQDNFFRSASTETPVTKIEIEVDADTGIVSVWNNGCSIPIRFHKWGKDENPPKNLAGREIYEPELIFGVLNTSSNYNDRQTARIGAGSHGQGGKLANIFSSAFSIEIFDPESNKRYVQHWRENMRQCDPPQIKELAPRKGYTCVKYTADFARFAVAGYSNDHLAVIRKLAIDCALVTGVKVIFNGETIAARNLSTYAKLFCGGDANLVEFKSDDAVLVITPASDSLTGGTVVSFVNGITTSSGGIHVDTLRKVVYTPLLEKLTAKFKKSQLKFSIKTIDKYFCLFICCNLKNPEFSNQTKEYLISPAPIMPAVTASKINAILRWDFVAAIEESVQAASAKVLAKASGKKTTKVSVTNASDAKLAGTRQSHKCILYITEGLSAQTFVTKGIGVIKDGIQYNGTLPIKGKLLNVRKASDTKITENKEISAIVTMLGLKFGADYSLDSTFKTLRYGAVAIMTDADVDGIHIKGLIINFFHAFWPALLQRHFLVSIRTPIVKVTIGKKVQDYYYLQDFKNWVDNTTTKNYSVKYYKGLGTSSDAEVKQVFAHPHHVDFIHDDSTDENVRLVFDEKREGDRKLWLETFTDGDPPQYPKNDDNVEQVPIGEFMYKDLIQFSIHDCSRSIPAVMDGLKPSQRKVLYTMLQQRITDEIKVDTLAGKITECTKYHSGEVSIKDTIIGMAQSFVGANNVPLIEECGQFGSRLHGGHDAASSRYISTKLAKITRKIFRVEDDPLLVKLYDDGAEIEPQWFVPIIPMVLVNGADGIGTGYSSTIPCFNPLDLIRWIKQWLNKKDYMTLVPWYRNFTGTIDPIVGNKFECKGLWHTMGENCWAITELPIGVWTKPYEEKLEKLTQKRDKPISVKELRDLAVANEISVTGTRAKLLERLTAAGIKLPVDGIVTQSKLVSSDPALLEFEVYTKPGITPEHSAFGLTTTLSMNNMTAFLPTGGIKQFKSVNDLLETFCVVRLEHYFMRKTHTIAALEHSLALQVARVKFIKRVLQDVVLLKQPEQALFEQFEASKYPKNAAGNFRYLTDMPVRSFTEDHLAKLEAAIIAEKAEIEYIRKKSPQSMWETELAELEQALKKENFV